MPTLLFALPFQLLTSRPLSSQLPAIDKLPFEVRSIYCPLPSVAPELESQTCWKQ